VVDPIKKTMQYVSIDAAINRPNDDLRIARSYWYENDKKSNKYFLITKKNCNKQNLKIK
jgi:hypothetical protein